MKNEILDEFRARQGDMRPCELVKLSHQKGHPISAPTASRCLKKMRQEEKGSVQESFQALASAIEKIMGMQDGSWGTVAKGPSGTFKYAMVMPGTMQVCCPLCMLLTSHDLSHQGLMHTPLPPS